MAGQFPAWFPDPTSQTTERFWNGARWTDRSRIAIPSTGPDGSPNLDRSLRLEDFLQPVEPIILAILGVPDLRDPEPQLLENFSNEPNDVLDLFGR